MLDRSDDKRFVKWAKKVKERDDFTCQICLKTGVYLNSHHMNSWDMFVKERYDLDNGVTLCYNCHDLFHSIYGRGRNTKFQFKEFRETIGIIKQVAQHQARIKSVESLMRTHHTNV